MFLNNYIKPQEIISSKSICGSCQFSRENRNYNQINISVHAMTTWRARNKCFWYNRLNCPPELLLLLLVFTATMVLNKTYSRYNTWWNLYTRKLSLLQSFEASQWNQHGWMRRGTTDKVQVFFAASLGFIVNEDYNANNASVTSR